MRTFGIFLLLFVFAAAVAGLLTVPVWVLLQQLDDVPIHRVMNRLGLLVLAVSTLVFLRRRGLADKSALGYDMPRPMFIRQMLTGLGAGVLLMLPVLVATFALGIRTPSPELTGSDSHGLLVGGLVVKALLTGFAVSFLEETYFRGAMFTAAQRESGLLPAILLPTALYAGLHFLGVVRIPAEEVTYWSGPYLAASLFSAYATPLVLIDSFLALAAIGVLLALIRHRTGAIAGCIGLHAGGVTMIVLSHHLSVVNPRAPLGWLVGSYDGVIGWMAFAWIAVVAAAYWVLSSRRSAVALMRQSPSS